MSVPPLTVRPVVHTDHLDTYLDLYRALGATVITRDPMWSEVTFGAGRIALHALFDGVAEGEVAFGFETTDLAAVAGSVTPPEGMRVALVQADHGTAVEVTGRDGLTFTVDERPDASGPDNGTWVKQLWVSPDVPRAAEDLRALGLALRLTETNGRTIDLSAAEGGVLVHHADEGRVGATYEIDVPDLDAAHKALLDAGFAHDVIDETHGRTLKVALPGTDRPLWVVREDDDPVGVIRHD